MSLASPSLNSAIIRLVIFGILFTSPVVVAEVREPNLAEFREQVAPLLTKFCFDCHDKDTQEGKFALDSIDPDIVNGPDLEHWRLVFEQLKFHDMPPKDADQPTAAQRNSILNWIRTEQLKTQWPDSISDEKLTLPQFGNYVDHEFLFNTRLARVYPAPPRLWRLRPDIYNAIMPRLAESVSGLANGLNEIDGSDFKDYAAPYFLDEAAATPLLDNAKKIADRMVAEKSKDKVFKELVSEDGPPTDETIIAAIEHAFRKVLYRPPTEEEAERFLAFHHRSTKIGGYQNAGKALLTAILLQPEVLYRQELGTSEPDEFGRSRLSPREIAFALSYAFEDRPLEEFLSAAAEGELNTKEQVAAAVRRRLADDSKLQGKNPRVLQFFREYFHYPFANEVFKDNPEGGSHEPNILVSDLETTVRDAVRIDRQVLATLLSTRKFYVNAHYVQDKKEPATLQGDLRKKMYPTVYNLPPDWKWSAKLQPVEFHTDERAGVLTHPAWLAAWSGNFDNHPVQRGKWIRTHLLGGSVPDVPIGVDARVPEKEHTSFRDRLALATHKAECWRCHRKMDPLGVTLERYDHYGRYQRLDAGQPVDASGEITRTGVAELDGKTVSGPTELMDVLADSEYVEQVFVRHLFRYLLGRNETLGDANTLQDAHAAYRQNDGSLRELIVSILSSDSFLYRQSYGAEKSTAIKGE